MPVPKRRLGLMLDFGRIGSIQPSSGPAPTPACPSPRVATGDRTGRCSRCGRVLCGRRARVAASSGRRSASRGCRARPSGPRAGMPRAATAAALFPAFPALVVIGFQYLRVLGERRYDRTLNGAIPCSSSSAPTRISATARRPVHSIGRSWPERRTRSTRCWGGRAPRRDRRRGHARDLQRAEARGSQDLPPPPRSRRRHRRS
jgi:hypothetical protein